MGDAASSEEKCCGILLAAGSGTRFRGHADVSGPGATHKLLADLRGRPVYRWALDAVLAAGLDELVVVTGAAELTLPADVRRVHNDRHADGQATSLRCGLAAAEALGSDAVVVGLADQPFVTAAAWRAVAAADAVIAVATYAGQRGNPVKFRREVWPDLPTQGDLGGRSLIRQRPDLVRDVPCDGSFADIDTMEDLQQWNS